MISGYQLACLPIEKKMPVVHWSASAFNTAGVFSGHGPSSKVSTTSWSCRKSSCLKCSKPNPGPPVVSTSTVRLTPSASGLVQGGRFGCTCCGAGVAAACCCGAGRGVGAACGAAAPAALGGALCDQATPGMHSETAKINPAATRILLFPRLAPPSTGAICVARLRGADAFSQTVSPRHIIVGPARLTQRFGIKLAELLVDRVNSSDPLPAISKGSRSDRFDRWWVGSTTDATR